MTTINDLFITDEQAKKNKKRLVECLSINKQMCLAIKQKNMEKLIRFENKVGFQFIDKSLNPLVSDIAQALTYTKIDGKGERSTALTQAYDRLWTIGSFGSIFIDIKVKGRKVRVHLIDGNNSRFQDVFFIESLAD